MVGRKPTHICPQYGIHGNLKLLKFVIDYAKENNIPVRIPMTVLSSSSADFSDSENYSATIMLRRAGIKSTNYLFSHIVGNDSIKAKNDFLENLSKVKDGESAEILFHPSFFDLDILKFSSLNYERARDVVIATDKDFKQKILDMGFEIVDYSKI
ncbi:MAG: hypothetical protein Fur0024_0640 [Patescibacteria group bacterium]